MNLPLWVVLGALLWPAFARADWPVPRGDVSRTANVDSAGDLRDPAISWRYYLGGAINERAARMHDLDDDGLAEVVFVSAGRLIAKERDDRGLWQTPIQGIQSIVGVADFDGDGSDEIAAASWTRIFLVESRSGAVLWRSPAGDFGAIDAVRIGDLDGDGRADLVAATCPCCRVSTSTTGFAYRFADGFSADADEHRAWELPETSCGGRYSMVLWDPNGDGRLDVTYSNSTAIGTVDGTTGLACLGDAVGSCQEGAREYVMPIDLGVRSNAAHCVPANIDGRVGDELVCMQNNGPPDQPDNSHRVFVIEYRPAGPSEQARLALRWQRVVGTRERLIAMGAQPVVDLDGDGRLEIVVSGVLADDRWATYILDADTGARLAEIADHRIVGTVDLAAVGQPDGPGGAHTILTDRDETTWAWSFQRQDSPPVRGRWSLPGRAVMTDADPALLRTTHLIERVSARDLTGDGRAELLLSDRERTALYAYDVAGITPVAVAAYQLAEASAVLEAWTLSAREGEPAALFVAATDGLMHALDSGFARLDAGLRFGGYYPKGDWRNLQVTAVTGDLGAGADSVVITDARGALIRIDARANPDTGGDDQGPEPTVVWSRPNTSYPIIVSGMADGAAGIACRQVAADGSRHIQILSPDGAPLRDYDINGDRDARLLSDLVPAQLDDDGVTDLIIQWGEPGDLALHIEGLDGASLTSKWDAVPPFAGTTRFPAGGAVTDWNGDGVDDFVHQYYRTQIISGTDGALLAETGENGVFYMPIVTQLDDDPRPELLLQGGFNPVRAVDDDLAPMWQSTEDSRPYPYGALARCGSATYLIEGSLAEPAALHRTRVDMGAVADGAPTDTWTRILAHGQIYTSVEDARAEDDFLGQLTSAVVHSDLTGDGRPIALVGSEEGFLYAIDVCAGAMEFMLPFAGSVGAIAFGDTDGDGFEEVLVAVADGYLYAIDSGDGSKRGYLVGCHCDSGGPFTGSWLLALAVVAILFRRRRLAR